MWHREGFQVQARRSTVRREHGAFTTETSRSIDGSAVLCLCRHEIAIDQAVTACAKQVARFTLAFLAPVVCIPTVQKNSGG